MRLPFSVKSLLTHTLNAVGPRQNNTLSPQKKTAHETSSNVGSHAIANASYTSMLNSTNAGTPTVPFLASYALDQANAPLLSLVQPRQLNQRFVHDPQRHMVLEPSELTLARAELRENNAAMANKDLSSTQIFQLLAHPTVKREAQITSSAWVYRVERSTHNEVTVATSTGFPYLKQALSNYENLLAMLLRQEQIRTGETAKAIEVRIVAPLRDFFSKVINALPLQNYAPRLDSPIHVSSAELCHAAYDQIFAALPITHPSAIEGRGILPNMREHLSILHRMAQVQELAVGATAEEGAKVLLLRITDDTLTNTDPVTRDNELATRFASTNEMRDYYCKQIFDLYLGRHALVLDERLDWKKVKAHIHTPAQAFAAVFENLSERERIEYKRSIDDLGWRFARAFSDSRPMLAVLSTYSEIEKAIFIEAMLIYHKVHHTHDDLQGDKLLSLQNRFAHSISQQYQKNQIFLVPSANSAITRVAASSSQMPLISFGNIALENAQGKNFDQLLNEPSLQNILGFNRHSTEKQTQLLRERLIEKGESPEPRYPIGSFFHSVASTLIRVLQMQGQPIPADFGSEAELMQRFIEVANRWKTTRNVPIDPLVLLGLHLASSSNEQIINADSTLTDKMKALSAYIQARWDAHMGSAPPAFNRREEALNILVAETRMPRHSIENSIRVFSEMVNGAITQEYRMTLLDYFLKCADNNKSLRVAEGRLHPHQLLQQAEEKYNDNLKTNLWIINRAKENLREHGIPLTPPEALDREIVALASTYQTQTENQLETQRLLHVWEQFPILGSVVSLVAGIATHDKDTIIGAIPVIGQAYNLEEGVRTHDAQRAIGAIPILGSGQSVIQSVRDGDAVATYMSALGFAIDIETSGSGMARTASQSLQTAASTIRNLGEHQLPHHMRLGLEHTAAVGEALDLPLRSLKLGSPQLFATAVSSADTEVGKNTPLTLFDIHDPLGIKKEETSLSPLKQRLQQFANQNPQFKQNGWAQIVDPELGGESERFILTRLAEESSLILLKEGLGGRYEMFDLETGQAKNNGIGIYKTIIDDQVKFYRGGLLGGGNLDWKKSYPQLAKELDQWLSQPAPGEQRRVVYRKIDDWMSRQAPDAILNIGGCGLERLPPLSPTVQNLYVSGNRLTTLEGLPADLRGLHAEHNLLTSLPADLPKNLEFLYISYNQLAELSAESFSALTQLKELHAACNRLSYLPSLPNTVEHLNIQGNVITELLSSLPIQLKFLDASNNPLTGLPPKWPKELSVLKLSKTALSGIATLPKRLKILDLEGNTHFQNWPQQWPFTLKELHMSRCDLDTMAGAPRLPDGLEKLDLSYNRLTATALPAYLPKKLKQLVCSHNEITTLPVLPKELQELIANHNHIDTWPAYLPPTLLEINLESNRLSGSLTNHLPKSLRKLNLVANTLTALPNNLPSALRQFQVSRNQLTVLPPLPPHLNELSANRNRLTTLPPLPESIGTVDVANNQLSSLPLSLPANLRRLYAANNQLTSLSERTLGEMDYLGAENNQLTVLSGRLDVRNLNVNGNQLTSLPEALLLRGPRYTIWAEHNPFSPEFRARISIPRRQYVNLHITPDANAILASQRAIEVSMAPPLAQTVGKWYSSEERMAVEEKWNGWKNELKSSSFAQFLEKLSSNLPTARAGSLKEQVRTLLTRASQDNQLRATLFSLAEEGLGSCGDRILLTYNEMTKVQIEIDAARGAYDNALRVLIPLARQTFRLDKLAEIAAQKMMERPNLDDVEVYLAYQDKLRQRLQLSSLPATEMLYDSRLTDDDFANAERQVKQAENSQFVPYLADWQPWQKVLQRLDPRAYNQAREKLSQQADENFEQALSDYFNKNGLPDNEQMRAEHGPTVSHEISNSVYKELTEKFVETQALSSLLKPAWEEVGAVEGSNHVVHEHLVTA